MLARVENGTWRRMTEVFRFVRSPVSFAFVFFFWLRYLLFKLYASTTTGRRWRRRRHHRRGVESSCSGKFVAVWRVDGK